MPNDEVKLRGTGKRRHEVYPLGEIPSEVILSLAQRFVHRMAIGQKDIRGDDFGDIFANAVNGKHLASPLGVADVINKTSAWSVKTVKSTSPHTQKRVKLISGRNSPDYSMGISDPRADPQKTGDAVLRIWNARVNEVFNKYNDMRVIVLIRNFSKKAFAIFEQEISRYIISNYFWEFNKGGNLEGFNVSSNVHVFTWQPHGSQFTVIKDIPPHARHFHIAQKIPIIDEQAVLTSIKFSTDWVDILK